MKKLLPVLLCLMALGLKAQYDDERFPISADEIAFNQKHKIASLVITETTNGRDNIATTRYNKNGLLTYKQRKSSTENVYYYQYNKQNRLVEIADSNFDVFFKKWWHNTTHFEYYKNGLLKERNLNGNVTSYSYNEKEGKLTLTNLDESIDETSTEYFYNKQQKLIKTIKKGFEEVETITYEYDNQGREIKKLKVNNFPHSYDSIIETNSYNNNGQPLKSERYIIRTTPTINDDGEAVEGPLEIEKITELWECTYDNTGRVLTIRTANSEQPLPLWDEVHTFTIENGIETETIAITKNGTLTTNAITLYDAKGMKTQTTTQETVKGKTQETLTKYLYTYY